MRFDELAGTPGASCVRGRSADLRMVIQSGNDIYSVLIADEVSVATGASPDAAFSLIASPEAWDEFAKPVPAVGYQSIVAMVRMGHLRVEGDVLEFGRHLLFLAQLFASLRTVDKSMSEQDARGPEEPMIEPVVGRYLRLDLDGRPHRIYFEEAGQGIPLVCLHTAGADGRQYRALLNDRGITARFRVIAFDLPWHGKSSPPPGFERERYRLTTDLYVDTVMAVCRALKLEQPVVMGCSIGGRAVLHLALRHGNYFRAAIGLQSATHADPGADTRLRDLGILHRPDVHGQEAAAGSVACLIAPTSPEAEKWETLWHYMQGGPGIFLGDLHYYFTDGDLRNGLLDGLDTRRCPLHLLTGEYDISATPALTAELAKLVKATSFRVMEGLGHFPMSENPAQFRKYLLPVLERIADAG
ncbi:MAG: 2-hydroxy-6-oxo-6-phenylhexa-2,4-dienoate hydrolase [Enhydrobacter sp.]|nr:MAG: 2-hydroxy-6-oxo-6-phenylhexa-2,4-dienoate hydrolase [Enhydrobacter sp.]